jgi:hypothetical protein
MAGVTSMQAVALAALILAVLSAPFAAAKKPAENYTTSATSYSSSWLPARATWYGAPTGAGPYDNGMDCSMQNALCSALLLRCLL